MQTTAIDLTVRPNRNPNPWNNRKYNITIDKVNNIPFKKPQEDTVVIDKKINKMSKENAKASLLAALMMLSSWGLTSPRQVNDRQEATQTTIQEVDHGIIGRQSFKVDEDKEILLSDNTSLTQNQTDDIIINPTIIDDVAEDEEIIEIDENYKPYMEIMSEEEYNEAINLLNRLEKCGGDAWDYYYRLCDNLKMDRVEATAYLSNICNDENFGNGCVDPVILCALLMQESEYIVNRPGPQGGAQGMGQLHKCAVDEVNRIFKTNYAYEDRHDPFKTIEIVTLYLRHCFNRTGYQDAMLAMYNQGPKTAIKTDAGKAYVRAVYGRLNNYIKP